ncbi:hypothetical protein ACHQM5_009140 [Ranunculus cassubicifolius]
MSYEPFYKLVKLTGRAFYDDYSNKGDQLKNGKIDNRGMAVVILDALTRRQWVREDDLAKDLKLHSKQLRRTLRFFEEEKLVTRDHRKETARGVKVHSAAVAATADGKQIGKEGEEKVKLHTHSYCCLDYAQLYDVVRYRLHRMKKKLKDELESKNTVQEYTCPSCHKRYTAFDALQLISVEDGSFRCESCRSELVAETDKFAADEGDADDNARRRRREKLKEMLEKMEAQLKPLTEQLNRVKELPPPDFGTLQAWEAKASAAARANGDSITNDSFRSSQGQGFGGTPMSYLGDTKVEVDLSGVLVTEDDVKPDVGQPSAKVLPPWMIKTGMNLTDEQRGETKQEVKREISSAIEAGLADVKKSSVIVKDEKMSLQDEYYKAYYAAILEAQQAAQRQQVEEQSNNNGPTGPETPTDRRVGVKSKREENESDEDDEWEEAPASGQPVTKMYDLNVEATASGEDDDEDDIWEEG